MRRSPRPLIGAGAVGVSLLFSGAADAVVTQTVLGVTLLLDQFGRGQRFRGGWASKPEANAIPEPTKPARWVLASRLWEWLGVAGTDQTVANSPLA